MRRSLGVLGLSALIFTLPALAEAAKDQDPRWRFGLATWVSQGRTDFSHDVSGADPRFGNPTSRLQYQNLDNTVVELEAEVRLFWRMSLSARGKLLRAGSTSGGTLLDDDFLSAQGAAEAQASISGAHRFSRTLSQVDRKDIGYFNIELARHLLPRRVRRGHLKLFVSARSWNEDHLATGVEQLECTVETQPPDDFIFPCAPAGAMGLEGEPVISEAFDWLIGFVGVKGDWSPSKRFELSGRLGLGLADVETDDVHFKRTDLAQDPSGRWIGDGTAVDVELSGHYRLSPRLRLALGYRLWTARVTDGTALTFLANGDVGGAPLREYESVRDGWLLSLEFRTAR